MQFPFDKQIAKLVFMITEVIEKTMQHLNSKWILINREIRINELSYYHESHPITCERWSKQHNEFNIIWCSCCCWILHLMAIATGHCQTDTEYREQVVAIHNENQGLIILPGTCNNPTGSPPPPLHTQWKSQHSYLTFLCDRKNMQVIYASHFLNRLYIYKQIYVN